MLEKVAVELVQIQHRQYSLDGRRIKRGLFVMLTKHLFEHLNIPLHINYFSLINTYLKFWLSHFCEEIFRHDFDVISLMRTRYYYTSLSLPPVCPMVEKNQNLFSFARPFQLKSFNHIVKKDVFCRLL